MIDLILILPIIISFFISFLALPFWIKKAKNTGLMWKDMNKFDKRKVSGAGGIIVVMGFIIGILIYIAINTFIWKSYDKLIEIFALMTSILILTGVGIVDDLLGWSNGGLSKKFRIFMTLFAAVPLIVINAGTSEVAIPFINGTNLGILFALIIVPIGIIGAATTFNFLAGYNGLEAGQGIIILTALSFVAHLTGNSWLAIIGLTMVAALIAFLIFNKYPAKVFPGDTLTYPVGALIAIIAILGNLERIAVFFFIPYIIETGLKLRGRLRKQSFAKADKNNNLELLYQKIYGLEHLSILILKKISKNNAVKERDVVHLIYLFQIIIIMLALFVFRSSIF